MPDQPVRSRFSADGGRERWFDVNRNGRADYRERFSPGGRMTAIGYDRDEDGQVDEDVVLDQVPQAERRYLVLLLDSVPFSIAKGAWQQGRFRYCAEPARVIGPFPVMTDLSFSEFFGVSPSPGVESEYYDGQRLRDGYGVYLNEGNARWLSKTDYHLPQILHGSAYLDVEPWFGHELRQIQELFLNGDRRLTIGYCVGTSGLGATQSRGGHRKGLALVDRLCRQLLYQTRGRARFALLSDHGHYFTAVESRRLPLRDLLEARGYRITDRLRGPRDLVIPEFEMVSAASIWTYEPRRVAADVAGFAGVELAAYLEGERLWVVSGDGKAAITKRGDGFRYSPEYGDPLRLRGIWQRLESAGQVSADGFVADRVLFEATRRHVYPDGVARLWRAFHGLVEHTPDVIVALREGYHGGSAFQTRMVKLVGVHGNLREASTCGFAMSSEGGLPDDIRMQDLRTVLKSAGIPFNDEDDRSAYSVCPVHVLEQPSKPQHDDLLITHKAL
jgi:hypothetical protein